MYFCLNISTVNTETLNHHLRNYKQTQTKRKETKTWSRGLLHHLSRKWSESILHLLEPTTITVFPDIVKSSPIFVTEHWAQSWSQCTGNQPAGDFSSPSSKLPLLSARPAVTFPAKERHRPSICTKLHCLVTDAHRCEQLTQGYCAALSGWECNSQPIVRKLCLTATPLCHFLVN